MLPFPPLISRESVLSEDDLPFTSAYQDAVVYDEATSQDPLYEGPIIVHANGWIELEGNRLLSPSAIHHIDVFDDRLGGDRGNAESERRPGDGGGTGDERTGRYSPR
ncbi:hypothetical protein AB7C87_02235 [Natrarchaeobius sp. A-rgal3]|uniref:hypothetical protein n=1 Tax=Natrarchaeobius versutus TaxID=1679078 RepID=UPI003510D026